MDKLSKQSKRWLLWVAITMLVQLAIMAYIGISVANIFTVLFFEAAIVLQSVYHVNFLENHIDEIMSKVKEINELAGGTTETWRQLAERTVADTRKTLKETMDSWGGASKTLERLARDVLHIAMRVEKAISKTDDAISKAETDQQIAELTKAKDLLLEQLSSLNAQSAAIESLTSQSREAQATIVAALARLKGGAPANETNDWAWEAYLGGRSVDDLIDDYIRLWREETGELIPEREARLKIKNAINYRKRKQDAPDENR